MFTGIVEDVGSVIEAIARRGSMRIAIRTALPSGEMKEGDSISVDGVCLTVLGCGRGSFRADVIEETLSRTTLRRVKPGARVNLERPLRLNDRLGGHLVQGHVDAVARVVRVTRRGDDYRLRVALAPAIRRFVAEKGSVALQGVSLTVASLDATSFEVALIPETLSHTTLAGVGAGDEVNVEVDLLARYLERLMEAGETGRPVRTRRRVRIGGS